MTDSLDSLDDLFRAAKKHIIAERATPRRRQVEAPFDPSTAYSNEQFWTHTRDVAIIHSDTGSLMGNFAEWTHKTIPDCRKLVRDVTIFQVDAVEHIAGKWFHSEFDEPRIKSSDEYQDITVLVTLTGLELSCTCSLRVWFFWEGISRADLLEEGNFSGKNGLIQIPAGTNIFPALTKESKIAIKKELESK